jgi:tetratricopeptide (TPR) repeat protein
VAALVAVAVGAWGLRAFVLGRPAPSPQPTGVASLTADVIDTLVKLARRRLEAGDYADAARQAEKALKIDATNAEARAVLEEATVFLSEIEAARAALREAGGGTDRVARAAFELMKLDPASPEATSAASAAAAGFGPHAEAARRLAADARAAADAAGGRSLPAFAEGVVAEGQGQRALQGGRPVEAARHFLEARLRFDRARPGRP